MLVKGLIERDGVEGFVEPHKFLICIDASLKKNKRVFDRVLAHELCHCYAFESGLHEILSHQALEQFCQTMSSLICSLVKSV
jgi:hypothetical protein